MRPPRLGGLSGHIPQIADRLSRHRSLGPDFPNRPAGQPVNERMHGHARSGPRAYATLGHSRRGRGDSCLPPPAFPISISAQVIVRMLQTQAPWGQQGRMIGDFASSLPHNSQPLFVVAMRIFVWYTGGRRTNVGLPARLPLFLGPSSIWAAGRFLEGGETAGVGLTGGPDRARTSAQDLGAEMSRLENGLACNGRVHSREVRRAELPYTRACCLPADQSARCTTYHGCA